MNTKRRTVSEMYSNQWIESMKKAIADLENNGLNKPDRTYSNLIGMLLGYKCLADVAIEYVPPRMLRKIVVDAETICNKIGISLIQDGDNVSKCLTKKHSQCTGAYVSTRVKRTLFCRCPCHSKRVYASKEPIR